jgi:hypothetical protein
MDDALAAGGQVTESSQDLFAKGEAYPAIEGQRGPLAFAGVSHF